MNQEAIEILYKLKNMGVTEEMVLKSNILKSDDNIDFILDETGFVKRHGKQELPEQRARAWDYKKCHAFGR